MTVPDEAAKMWKPSAGGLVQMLPAPTCTFVITRKNGDIEEVNSCFVEFTAHHVLFRDSNGHIDYGLHANELIDIKQGEHS